MDDLRELTENQLGDMYLAGDSELRARIELERLDRTNKHRLGQVTTAARAEGSPVWFRVDKTDWQPGWVDHYRTHPYEIRYRTVSDVNHRGNYRGAQAGRAGNYRTREEAIFAAKGAGWTQVRDWAEAREHARPYLEDRQSALEREWAAKEGTVEVRIGAEVRYVSRELAEQLAALLSTADEYGVVRETRRDVVL